MNVRTFFCLALAMLAAALPATGQIADGGRAPSPAGAATNSTAPTFAAQFQATVYEVLAPSDRLGALDAKKLAARAATAEGLLKALSASGEARILYRIDQPVNIFSERITIGASEPIVTGSRISANGQAINSITYHQVGVIIRMTAQPPMAEAKRTEPDVSLNVQLAALGRGEVEIVPGQKASTVHTIALEHSEPLAFAKPAVALSVTSTSTAPQAQAVAYVVRYVFYPAAGK